MTRRRPAYRLTSALVGAIVAAMGVVTMALLSGRVLDTELVAIVALAAAGGWLVISALLPGARSRAGGRSTQDWEDGHPIATPSPSGDDAGDK